MKLGIRVSLATVSRYVPRPMPDPTQQQRWMTFLRNHKDVIAGPADEIRDLNHLIQAVEVAEIEKALRLHHNNKTKAAEGLNISRFALQRKMEKYGIELSE